VADQTEDIVHDLTQDGSLMEPGLVIPGTLAATVPAAAFAVERSKSKKLGLFGWFSVVWLGIVTLMVFVPWIFPVPGLLERDREALVTQNFGPQAGHWLGVDTSGYDLLTKVIYGARASMMVAVLGILFALLVGGVLGLIAGYFRGKLDTTLNGGFNVMLAFPALVLALALVTIFASEPGVAYARRVGVVMFALAIVSIAPIARVTRANTLVWSEREFVLAARLLGTKTKRILTRDVLPNVAPAMLQIALLGIGLLIIAEGGLALLGVGIPAAVDTPSWGNLLASNRSQLFLGKPWGVFAPSIAIFLTILSLNYIGDVMRARLDVRESML
jgi:peptide/nickel transport system permease protein